ncbi:MAG: hypothetical protein AABY93_15770 [Bacteroidota bacterium]
MKKKCIALVILVLTFSQMPHAQTKAADSVIIRVGEGSKVIFAIKDKEDLETLKHYNFQALMEDMIARLENKDTSTHKKPSVEYLKDSVKTERQVTMIEPTEVTENWDDDTWDSHKHKSHHGRKTYHSINIDLGTNNYLSNGKFPDDTNELYSVRPWGSWFVGLNSIQRTRVSGKFFIEWGGGVSWYNFKFQNESTTMSKDDSGVIFSEDARDVTFIKSKLTAAYLNASLIPLLDFGGNRRKSSLFDGHGTDSFRIGIGPYAGYRIDSYAKQVYKEEGDKRKNRERDNFYLNNMRYGLRAQIGFNDIDLFISYDMNELFAAGKGPQLNAFSFGITL